ncbi:MAG: hypothetical protein QOE33_979 [Acidobacteriota bacterium]|nr:hypothetical protein [Acidobacteriota bacterium]
MTERWPCLHREKTFRWRFGVLAAALLALVALIPQAHLCLTRGHDWHGAYAYFYSDEPAYAAYLNALIDGRTRRNDPYTGADDGDQNRPLNESLFSIQFAPAYLLALPARALGLDASAIFILLMPLVAIGCALAIYWMAASITGDERASFATVFVVLCFGILVSGQGFFVNLLGGFSGYIFLPFLRRYVPGLPLVFFLLFCGATWRALASETSRVRLVSSLAAGALFCVLIYSYFYHWTAAAALVACLAPLWLAARPREERRAAATSFVIIGAIALVSLAPYLLLISHRAPTTDEMQALTHTHAPDLFRGVELLAAITLILFAWGARRGLVRWREREAVFTIALSLSVLAVFNQQIVTGLALQPMHYEQYVGNYVALLAFTIVCTLLWQGRTQSVDTQLAIDSDEDARPPAETRARPLVPHKIWITVALCALAWGACDALETTLSFARQNARHDDWRAVVRRLDELARESASTGQSAHPVVFNPDDFRMDHVPADSSCAVLWAPHMFSYSSLTRAENEQRVFQFLHFAGVAPRDFAAMGRDQGFLQFSIFGWERANPRLAIEFHPVTPEEIAAKQRAYSSYVALLEQNSQPPQPLINFVVVSDDQSFSRANLERFYMLAAIERVGAHTIYRATPKQP